MIKNIETLFKKLPAALLCGALGLSLSPLTADAAKNPKDRYECIAKSAGRSFTNGAITLRGYPCRVAPAEVDRLTKAKGADKRTDQINFDYFWNQAYFTNGRTLTDILDSGEREAGGARSITFVYRAVCQKGNLEASGAFTKIKEVLGFETEPSTAEVSGQIYSLCAPFDSAHYANAVMEQNADNRSQLLLYTSTVDGAKKKLMGAVDWISQTPEVAVATAEVKAPEVQASTEPKKSEIAASTAAVYSPQPGSENEPDADADGVPDSLDKCRNTPPRTVVDGNGCFPDADGDNVPDSRDKCPGTPKETPVDAAGCPEQGPEKAKSDPKADAPDSDADGVSDSMDKCPNTPPRIVVDAKGCFPDEDFDNVSDSSDKCPGTPKGTPVDARGCPAH